MQQNPVQRYIIRFNSIEENYPGRGGGKVMEGGGKVMEGCGVPGTYNFPQHRLKQSEVRTKTYCVWRWHWHQS